MNELHIKALHRAAALKGGGRALAEFLGVPEETVRLWMEARATIPSAMFMKVIDIVLAADLDSLSAPQASAPAAPLRVLVVDDDLGGAYSLARVVKELGYPVETATSGQAAIELAKRFRPDVVFLDLRIPDMDGFEIAAKLKREGVDAKIIAATAYGSEEDRKKTAEAGFVAHLVKPIDARALQKVLGRP
jgi:CheY-like chemotaxis protein